MKDYCITGTLTSNGLLGLLVYYDLQAECSGWLFKSPLACRTTDRTACCTLLTGICRRVKMKCTDQRSEQISLRKSTLSCIADNHSGYIIYRGLLTVVVLHRTGIPKHATVVVSFKCFYYLVCRICSWYDATVNNLNVLNITPTAAH